MKTIFSSPTLTLTTLLSLIYLRLFSTTTVRLLSSGCPLLFDFAGAAAALLSASFFARARCSLSSSLDSSELSFDSHSEELELHPPQRLPPQSSLTR